MGRSVKNPKAFTDSSAAVGIPKGGTANRSAHPTAGDLRYNTDTDKLEVYNGSTFKSLSAEGNVLITLDSFTGDGVTTSFTMSNAPPLPQCLVVSVGNVYQNPASAYTVSGTNITFTSPPGNTETITIVHGYDKNMTY